MPETGTFLSEDVWEGDHLRPQTFNGWEYVGGNPINFVDPSGQCYPPFEWLRNIPGETMLCDNLDLAIFISVHPYSSLTERVMADAYITAWTIGHASLISGGILVGISGIRAFASTGPIAQGIVTGTGTGTAIGASVEYTAQGLETYRETEDFWEAVSPTNKDWDRISASGVIGGVSGGLTGGVGSGATGINSFAMRQTVKVGTSAVVNLGANTSYVGTQACLLENASLEDSVKLSINYVQRNWQKDLLVGGFSSVLADITSFVGSRLFSNPNSYYYMPPPDFRVRGSRMPPHSNPIGAPSNWYPVTRVVIEVTPDAVSNTGLWTPLYDRLYEAYLQRVGGSP
jgi:hypothetical protein